MDCLFCGIVAKKVPAHVVFETNDSIAFLDINPRNPGHTLLIPKKHYETLMDMPAEQAGNLGEDLKTVSAMVQKAVQAQGISIVQNNGKAAGQVVAHAHFHVIPRFMNEGPVALESIMPSKKIDDASMKNIASKIKGSPKPVKTEKKIEKKPEKKPKEDDIDFNF